IAYRGGEGGGLAILGGARRKSRRFRPCRLENLNARETSHDASFSAEIRARGPDFPCRSDPSKPVYPLQALQPDGSAPVCRPPSAGGALSVGRRAPTTHKRLQTCKRVDTWIRSPAAAQDLRGLRAAACPCP